MNKEKKKMMVPKLRFAEFQEVGDWKEDTLVNVAKFRRGSFPQPYGLPEWYDEVNGMPFIQVFDVSDNLQLKLKTKSKISLRASKQSVFIPKGTVIITIQGSIGRVAITQYDAYIDRTLLLFEKFYIPIDKIFFAYILQILFEIEKQKAPGGIIKTITKEVLSDFIIVLPNIKEQQKIATFLTSLDTLITAQSQKIKALQTHKKGLMQQLFPAEGEMVPSVRFSEFEETGMWEEIKLENIATFSSGGTPSKDAPEYWGGEIPWISAASMYSTIIEKSDSNITEIAVKNGANIAKKGTLLILVRGSMLHNRIPMGITAKDVAFNQDVKALTLKKNIIDYFLLYQLMAKEYQILNSVTLTGIGAGKLDTDELRQFLIYIPSRKEQLKITDCFTSLDEIITTQTQKLEALKVQKKALMQQLFPNSIEQQDNYNESSHKK